MRHATVELKRWQWTFLALQSNDWDLTHPCWTQSKIFGRKWRATSNDTWGCLKLLTQELENSDFNMWNNALIMRWLLLPIKIVHHAVSMLKAFLHLLCATRIWVLDCSSFMFMYLCTVYLHVHVVTIIIRLLSFYKKAYVAHVYALDVYVLGKDWIQTIKRRMNLKISE